MDKEPINLTDLTNEVYTQNGLLYRKGVMINLPEADWIAKDYGFVYAEQLVRYLKSIGRTHQPRHITRQSPPQRNS